MLATCDERFTKTTQKLKLTNLKIVLIGEKVRWVEQAGAVCKVAKPSVVTPSARAVATWKKIKR